MLPTSISSCKTGKNSYVTLHRDIIEWKNSIFSLLIGWHLEDRCNKENKQRLATFSNRTEILSQVDLGNDLKVERIQSLT